MQEGLSENSLRAGQTALAEQDFMKDACSIAMASLLAERNAGTGWEVQSICRPSYCP